MPGRFSGRQAARGAAEETLEQIRTEVDGHGLPSEVLENLRIVGPIVREEIVAPVIISTSLPVDFPRSFFTPFTGAFTPTKPFTNDVSETILSPSPGVSLLEMTFIAISFRAGAS